MGSRVEQFEQIRRDRDREGLSLRALAARHGVHRRTVKQALLSPDPQQAGKLFRSAFEEERKAAELLEGAYDYEPTRSVLYRSAATLARDCRD